MVTMPSTARARGQVERQERRRSGSPRCPGCHTTTTKFPRSCRSRASCCRSLLANAARDFPDRAALIFFGQRISYRELDRLSNRFAHALTGLGIRRGERVAIVLPNVPQCVIAFYGALKSGAVAVMVSSLSSERPSRACNCATRARAPW